MFHYTFMEINCPSYLHEPIFMDANYEFQRFMEMTRNLNPASKYTNTQD